MATIETTDMATTCCVVGGGPAGIMLGYLLARQGVSVTVLEKHADFNRDFRGDTVHPSTLELMHELGLLQDFLRLPHQELTRISGLFGDFPLTAADFRHVPARCKFVALMPQWDFLSFLSERARKFPGFDLRMQHEAVGLLRQGAHIRGVEAQTPQGAVQIRADLVVGCDGRHSIARQAGRLEVLEFGVPIDVLWFRIRRLQGDPEQLLGSFNYGHALVTINRGEYFQAGLLIQKDSFASVQAAGMEAFRRSVSQLAPYLGDRVAELKDWEQVKLLSVQLNRLRQWYRPGLLCIGDAAHAMSPAGGVGINLAIQDAVATANLLSDALRERRVTEDLLAQVQRRREFPTRVTQWLQKNAHQVFARLFRNPGPVRAPWQLKAAVHIPGVQYALARVIGIGVRPEHIRMVVPTSGGKRLKKLAVGAGVAAAITVRCLQAMGRPGVPKPGVSKPGGSKQGIAGQVATRPGRLTA
jgi:2-polyprenyl-6-methoxyphenol hydroxylase-like FAD-dependent oxidoreductase